MADTSPDLRANKTKHLVFVQYLRGIAATLVVLHHALRPRDGYFRPFETDVNFGRPGVLIFFVISGFIMMHACRQESPVVFAKRRFIRVVPLYWIMTLAYFAIAVRGDIAMGEPFRQLGNLVRSLLFIPHYHIGVTDQIWPILVPGWTLNYEMFFFALFAFGIATGRPAIVTSLLLVALVLAGWAFPSDNALWVTWTNEFLLLFLAGICLALLWQRYSLRRLTLAFPVGLGLLVVSACKLLPEAWIVPSFFVCAILTVGGTLALQDRYPDASSSLLARIGDASYSIYLSHTIFMIVLYKALILLPLQGWAQFLVVMAVSLVTCTAVGIAIYEMVERPLIRKLRRQPPTIREQCPPPRGTAP